MVNKKMKGFTLIELMLTVAVMAILAMIAIPTYRHYITKAHLQEAKSALSQDYLYLEKLYTKNNGYKKNKTTLVATGDLPQKFSGSGNAGYDITVNSNCGVDDGITASATFCLKAKPRRGQASAAGGGKECGELQVDQTGKYKALNQASSGFKCF